MSVHMPGIDWPTHGESLLRSTSTEPLNVPYVSKGVRHGETVHLGGGDYILELTKGTTTHRESVVDGRFDTSRLPRDIAGKHRLTARRGSQAVPIGSLYFT